MFPRWIRTPEDKSQVLNYPSAHRASPEFVGSLFLVPASLDLIVSLVPVLDFHIRLLEARAGTESPSLTRVICSSSAKE